MRIAYLFFIICGALSLNAQLIEPEQIFSKYTAQSINSFDLHKEAKEAINKEVYLEIGDWELVMESSDIIRPGYRHIDQDGNVLSTYATAPVALKGVTRKGGVASITISDGFISGYVKENNETHYIEPARFFSNSRSKDEFIIYNIKDIKPGAPMTCGYQDVQRKEAEVKGQISSRAGLCYEIEYGIVNDFLMYDRYGSSAAVEARAISVVNDINSNYDDEFADEIRFEISGQFTSTCSSCESSQWGNSTDASTLLNGFSNWARNNLASTYNIPHDIASLWTGRDLNGSTVGLAWLGVVCSSTHKYNILQDIYDSGYQLRVLTAHELGHNLDAGHDGSSGYIMSPSVNNASVWSSGSVNSINSHIDSRSCLSICTDSPSTVFLSSSSGSVSENSTGGTGGSCNEGYIDFEIPVTLSKLPSSNLVVGISILNSTTATYSYDYTLVTQSLTFTPTGELVENIIVRVYDDKIVETDETFDIRLNVNSGPGVMSSSDEFYLTISSGNDEVSETCCGGQDIFFGEAANYVAISGMFTGDVTDAKSRMLFTASELTAYGFTAGPINGMDLYVYQKNSTQPFRNFSINYALISNTTLAGVSWNTSSTQVFSSDVTTAEGWNNFTFDSPIIWDGTSSIYFNFCFDNTSASGNDLIIAYQPTTSSRRYVEYSKANNTTGCSMTVLNYTYYLDYMPIAMLRANGGAIVETEVNKSSDGRIRTGETAHFYSEDNEVIASITNTGQTSMECVTVSVNTAGSGQAALGFASGNRTDKSIFVTADNNASYELTLYFTQDELSVWGGNNMDLNFIKSSVPLGSANSSNSSFLDTDLASANVGAGNNISYQVTGSGDGYYALTDGSLVVEAHVMGTFSNSDFIIHELGKGILLKNSSGDQYLVKFNTSGDLISLLANNEMPSAFLSEGDLLIDNSSRAICIQRTAGNFSEFNIDNNGDIIITNVVAGSNSSVDVESGNFGLLENGAGVVFKNSQNECWKLYVDEGGSIRTGEVASCIN